MLSSLDFGDAKCLVFLLPLTSAKKDGKFITIHISPGASYIPRTEKEADSTNLTLDPLGGCHQLRREVRNHEALQLGFAVPSSRLGNWPSGFPGSIHTVRLSDLL